MHNGELKHILTQQDLFEQGKHVTLSLTNVPDEALRKINSTGASLKENGNDTNVFCSRSQLKDIMNIAASHGIETSNLDVSSNTLERLFLNTISDDSVEEVCHT